MQELLDHLLSKKLKSATALVLQYPEGKQLISNRSEKNAKTYKEVAHQLITEQSKFVCFSSVCYRNISDSFGAANGVLDHPRLAAIVILWDNFQSCVFQNNDENSGKARQDDLKWLKCNWTRLISTFNTAYNNSRKEVEKREKRNILTSSKMVCDIATKITQLFENVLLKRNRNFEADKCWDSVGMKIFRNKIEQQIRKGGPIHFILPSFPFKSGNTRTKVLGKLPDMAEKLGLERLERFMLSLRNIYSPGGKLLIITDGRVYCELIKIPDSTVSQYRAALRKMINPQTSDIEWTDLDEIFPNPGYNNNDKREALLNIFGTSLENIVNRINLDADYCEVYKGIKKFVGEEFTFPTDWGIRAVQRECGRIAKLLVQRTDAYQSLIRCIYPYHIRLSIHPSTSTTKFSVDLVGKTDWGTPHNCALLQPDQSWALIRKATAEKQGFELCKCDDGMHYFVNNSGTTFTEKL